MSNQGGIQSCVISLIRGLNQRNIIPDIVWDLPPNWEMLREAGVQAGFYQIEFGVSSSIMDHLPHTFRYVGQWFQFIHDDFLGDYDFVYSFYNGFIAEKIPHVYYLIGPPLLPQLNQNVGEIRQFPFRFLQWLYKIVISRISPVFEYHRESNYIIISEFTAELFHDAHGIELPVIYPPINISNRRFNLDDLDQRDTVTFFSRIVDYKRPGMILKLAQQFPQFRYVIMGGVIPKWEPFLLALKDKANKMSLSNVVFLPNVTKRQALCELSRTRFFVFPGKNEHFGMVTPEAIASGAIPYVHNSGGQVEIVNEIDLRFTDDDFIEKFQYLSLASSSELNNYRFRLKEHIQQYSEDVYVSRMISYLNMNNC